MKHRIRLRKGRRRLIIERFERRDMMTVDTFTGYGSLTFSFAPDGTHVGQNISDLNSTFDRVASRQQWQQAVEKAFQTWSQLTNINVGQVDDDGSASGVYGPTRGDERFGDIRITGISFASDKLAEAVFESSRSVGTWAGDIFFNTAARWDSLQQIEAVALHEVGHVFGLEHSNNPNSPMHSHDRNDVLAPTNADILALQKIHGTRNSDPSEGAQGNNSIDKASLIRGSDEDTSVDHGFDGSQAWIQFGDLATPSDRDVYFFKTALGYHGPVSVEVRTKGLSLANLNVELTDRNGRVLAQGVVGAESDDSIILTINQTSSDTRYYVHVYSGADAFWAVGDFSVAVAAESVLRSNTLELSDWIVKAHRWYYDIHRLKNGFSWHLGSNETIGPAIDDHHTDDAIDKGSFMPKVLDLDSRVLYSVVGTLSDLTDIDHYRVVAPKVLSGRNELIIDLESLQFNGLVPSVRLYNRNAVLLSPEVRVKGYGQLQLVFSNVLSEQEFVIEIRAESVATEFRTGSYTLNASFTTPRPGPDLLLTGSLSDINSPVEREWYIAEPQLLGLSLQASASSSLSGQVWVSIYDSNRHLVGGIVSPIQELRSTPGLFFNPGLYYIQVATNATPTSTQPIDFRFLADDPSRPVGVLLGGTSVKPLYLCPGSTTEYCYPNSSASTDEPQLVGPAPATPLPPPESTQPAVNPSNYYWSNDYAPRNLANPLDANGDNRTDPLDVLLIINSINRFGIGPVPTPPSFYGYLDTNGNGQLEPLDVLGVVNFLNR